MCCSSFRHSYSAISQELLILFVLPLVFLLLQLLHIIGAGCDAYGYLKQKLAQLALTAQPLVFMSSPTSPCCIATGACLSVDQCAYN